MAEWSLLHRTDLPELRSKVDALSGAGKATASLPSPGLLMPGPRVELGTPEFSVPRLRGYRTTSPASIKKAT